WTGAEAEFRRAIALNPNYPTAHHWFAITLRSLRRFEEALAEIQLAHELDPLSPIIAANVGILLGYVGKSEPAIQILQKQMAFDPAFLPTRHALGSLYLDSNRLPEAIAVYEDLRRLARDEPTGLDRLGYAYARSGRTNDAKAILLQLQEL